MAHFAKVHNGIVTKVIVAEPEFISSYREIEPGDWIQTSYNTRRGIHYQADGTPSLDQSKALRKNFACVGMIYDKELDAFYYPQPYPSFTLDEQTGSWIPPIPKPNNPDCYWDENSLSWKLR